MGSRYMWFALLCLFAASVSAVVQDNFLLVADSFRNNIFQLDLASSQPAHVAIGNTAIMPNPVAVDYDPINKMVYWTDSLQNWIGYQQLSNSSSVAIKRLPEVTTLDGLAVDYINRLIYYTDAGDDVIGVMNMTLDNRKTLINTGLGSQPRAIVLDPLQGMMYWTDWGSSPKIEKAKMDGSGRSVVTSGNMRWPNGLAIDWAGSRLFWVDAGTDRIEMFNLNTGVRTLLRGPETAYNAHYFDVIYNAPNEIYVTDWGYRKLHRVDISSKVRYNFGETVTVRTRMMGIAMYKRSQQPSGSTACTTNNGGCQQLCLPTSASGRVCTCAEGYYLNTDQTSCSKLSFTNSVLFTDAKRAGVFRMDLDKMQYARLDIYGHDKPQFITAFSRFILWTDPEKAWIGYGCKDGSCAGVLKRYTSSTKLGGIAVQGSMVWVVINTSGTATLSRFSILGTGFGSLSTPSAEFIDVVVDPVRRYLFLSQNGTSTKIRRFRVSTGYSLTELSSIPATRPSGLTLDKANGSLYFADNGGISWVTYSCSPCIPTPVLSPSASRHLQGISLHGNYIYMGVAGQSNLMRVSQSGVSSSPQPVGPADFRGVFDVIGG